MSVKQSILCSALAAAQCIVIQSCLWVCVCVCVCGCVTTITRNCVHRSSPTVFVCKGSGHLQLIKFWPSHAPGKGVCGGTKNFGSALLQPACSVCISLSTFHFNWCWNVCNRQARHYWLSNTSSGSFGSAHLHSTAWWEVSYCHNESQSSQVPSCQGDELSSVDSTNWTEHCSILHCTLSLAVECIVIGPVCGFVCVCASVTMIIQNCGHRSSPNSVCR